MAQMKSELHPALCMLLRRSMDGDGVTYGSDSSCSGVHQGPVPAEHHHTMRAVEEHSRELQRGLESVWADLLHLAARLLAAEGRQEVVQEAQAALDTCDALGERIASLEHQLQQVTHQLATAARAVDMQTAGHARHETPPLACYEDAVEKCLLAGLSMGPLLLGLSDCYVHVRQLLAKAAQAAGCNAPAGDAADEHAGGAKEPRTWTPPDEFKRKVTKYWVRVEDVPRLKVALLRHLPLLVMGRPEGQLLADMAAGKKPACTPQYDVEHQSLLAAPQLSLKARCWLETEGSAVSDIASVYFDGLTAPEARERRSGQSGWWQRLPGFKQGVDQEKAELVRNPLPVYHTRLARHDGAALVRARWYGPEPSSAADKVYIERKVHRESWTGEDSVKERTSLQLGDMPAYIRGTPAGAPAAGQPAPAGGRSAMLLQDVQRYLMDWKQGPVLRTTYQRAAFQRADTNGVRVSLDMRLVMSRECLTASPLWLQDPPGSSPLHPNRQAPGATGHVQFPYAVLEVKLQDANAVPDWLQACRQSGLLVEAPKFSKFLHGMALLYPHLVRATPTWFVPASAGNVATAQRGMVPATIDQVAASLVDKDQALSSLLLGTRNGEESREQCTIIPTWQLPPGTNTRDPACAACMGRAAVTSAAGAGVPHTCALGLAWRQAMTWRVPAASGASTGGDSSPQTPAAGSAAAAAAYGSSLPATNATTTFTRASTTASASITRSNTTTTSITPSTTSSQRSVLGSNSAKSQIPEAAEPVSKATATAAPTCSSDASLALHITEASTSSVTQMERDTSGRRQWGWGARVRRVTRRWWLPGAGRRAANQAAVDEGQDGPTLPTARAVVMTRVEPKTFFAAERTFLQWVNLSVMIMFVALSLLGIALSYATRNQGGTTAIPTSAAGAMGTLPAMGTTATPSTTTSTAPEAGMDGGSSGMFSACEGVGAACRAGLVAGLLMAPVALVFMVYALLMYRARTQQILRREARRYDDQRGPVLLVLLLIALLVVSYVLTVRSVV